MSETLKDMLPFLIPLIILELGLLIFAIVDLVKRESVRGGNKVIWALVIIIVNFIGPIIYFIFGRSEKRIDSD